VIENEKEYDVELAAPGLTKEDFKIQIDADNNAGQSGWLEIFLKCARSPCPRNICAERPKFAHISVERGEICAKMGVFAHIWAPSEQPQ
jgi:hypothetical protein